MSKISFYLIILIILIKLVTATAVGDSGSEETDSLMSSIYYSSDVLLIGLIVTILPQNGLKKHIVYSLIFVAVLIFLVFVSAVYNASEVGETIKNSFKLFLPIIFLVTILNNRNNLDFRPAKIIPLLIVCLSFYALAFFPPSNNRKEEYWAIYFSGLHPHCYVLLSGLLIIVANYKVSKYPWWAKGYALFAIVGMIWGYNVRTTVVGLIILLLPAINKKTKLFFNKYFHAYTIISLIYVALFCAILLIDFSNLNDFSSGRLSMYEVKINMILQRGVVENLIGSGFRSDLVEIDQWWGEKGSHNDYLTIIIEYGFIFLSVLLLLFRYIYKSLQTQKAKSIFWIYFACSMFSNGLFFRPLPALITFLAIVIADKNRSYEESALSRNNVNSSWSNYLTLANENKPGLYYKKS